MQPLMVRACPLSHAAYCAATWLLSNSLQDVLASLCDVKQTVVLHTARLVQVAASGKLHPSFERTARRQHHILHMAP